MAEKKDLTKDEKIKKEIRRIRKALRDLDKNKLAVVEPLIQTAAFTAVSLAELEAIINENGFVVEYKNGENQFGTKQSDEVIGFVPKLAETGLNLIKGLWNGISDAGKWLWDKISGFFGGIVDKIKGFFGIHSPSTMFRDMIGKNLVKGIEVGVDVETPNLQENLEDNLSAATAGLKANIESEEMKLNVAAQNQTAGSGVNLGGMTLHIDTFINQTEKDMEQLTEEFMYTAENYIKRRGGAFA